MCCAFPFVWHSQVYYLRPVAKKAATVEDGGQARSGKQGRGVEGWALKYEGSGCSVDALIRP